MNRKNFLIVILLFFSKIFIVKCENRKVRLYLFFNGGLYRYFSEKNEDYNNFNNIEITNAFGTDYEIKDNILDLKEIDEKIKNKQIIFKSYIDFYDGNKKIDINNCKITLLKLLSDVERSGFGYQFTDRLKENFYRYEIKDLNNKVKIPADVNFVYIFFEDFSNIDLFKKGTIGHLFFNNGNKPYPEKENFTDIADIIKISDLYDNQEYIEKCDYSENNNQLKELLSNKLLNDDKYKNLEFKFNNLTKNGDETFKIAYLKEKGVFISNIKLNDTNNGYLNLKNNRKNDNMYLNCDIKFKRKVKIIFNIPENTELDLGLSMKQETEVEFDSFNQKSIENGLKDAISKIFTNKSILNNGHTFMCSFWQGYEGIWPEKYIVKNENGDNICTIIEPNDNNYIDIMDKDNLTFEIYLKPGSELLKGIHVTLNFKPVDGKFVSKELEKMPKNTNIIGRTDMDGSVFLCKGENYIEQIKNILKEGYFNKQKISLDDDCYQLYLRTYSNNGDEIFIPLTDNNQLKDDVPMIFILFNNNAIGKYIKNNEADPDPVYYGDGKDTDRNKTKFDDTYEYTYNYNYLSVTGEFENYYNYFNKINQQVEFIKKEDKPEDGNPGDGIPEGGNQNQTPITTPEDIDGKNLKNLGCCAKCMKCCCCCKPKV